MSELETHPCFTAKCSDYARIHLPVAPKCNMQCNYCMRKYSCVNESRPGVVARVMVPEDAVDWYLQMKAKVPKLTVAGIAGPGDALANWPAVSRTLSMIRMFSSACRLTAYICRSMPRRLQPWALIMLR